MDRHTIIAGLREEIDALNRAIEILEGSGGNSSGGKSATTAKPAGKPGRKGKRRKMSAEAKARIGAATKARWAKLRKEKAKK